MTTERKTKLKRNFAKMFWIKAFLHINLFGIVGTLFYLHRGLSLSQIFFTAIIFSVVNIALEIPSSYLADRFGRKKTITLACISALIHWIVFIWADSFAMFAFSFIFLSATFALMSGTDEALVYDTNKELGDKKNSLEKLGKFYSAEKFFRVITPIIAVLIVKDLVEWQFLVLIFIQMISVSISIIISFSLIEPDHYADIKKLEAGIITDAFKILKNNKLLLIAILNKTFIFISAFIVWRYHQKFFVDLDISIIAIGVAMAIMHGCIFVFHRNIKKFFPSKTLEYRINFLNTAFILVLILFVIVYYTNIFPYILLLLFIIFDFFTDVREPLFSDYFNKRIRSFNRASTISMTKLLKSILDIPLLVLASLLVSQSPIFPYYLSILIAMIAIIFFRLKKRNSHRPL